MSYKTTAIILFYLFSLPALSQEGYIRGFTFLDSNKNGVFETSEQPLSNILISNGLQIVASKTDGSYEIAIQEEQTIFVIKT